MIYTVAEIVAGRKPRASGDDPTLIVNASAGVR